jgi:hypothetical protein
MKQIYLENLDDLAIGATILGSGGGGDPVYDLMIAKQQLALSGPVTVVNVDDIPDDALVVPIEFMGAPLVSIEMIPSGREFDAILKEVESFYGRKVDYLLTIEIGGANAFTPLIAASKFNIPLIDGDTLGRAFPELHISSCNLRGISSSPAFLCDVQGNVITVNADDAFEMEKKCRDLTTEMGSAAAIAFYIMSGKEAKDAIIRNTVSQAIALGEIVRKSENPVQALIECTQGRWIGSGTISDIQQSISGGFLSGVVKVEGSGDNFQIHYQNEYLVVYKNGAAMAMTPDILVLLEEETGKPIPSESVIFGLRVAIVEIPTPDIWKTAEGLAITAPECFGYEVIL